MNVFVGRWKSKLVGEFTAAGRGAVSGGTICCNSGSTTPAHITIARAF